MNPIDLLSMVKISIPEVYEESSIAFQTATASVNMKNYSGCLACLLITDAGTGSAVTMKQGTTTTASTALSFTKYYVQTPHTTDAVLTAATASSDTFTTATGSTAKLYIVPITADMLDKTFESEDTYVRMDVAAGADSGVVFYIMYGPRFGGDRVGMPLIG